MFEIENKSNRSFEFSVTEDIKWNGEVLHKEKK